MLAFDFDAMAERLRGLLESQRQLLRDVSHELRSPLARLQIALGLARRPNANLEQEFDRIEQETQRLDELIGEILSLSRLEDPARELIAEPVNLEELLETLTENARVEAEPRWVRVELQSPQPLTVAGDRELLFRALENVVRNAVSYSPHGSAVVLSGRQQDQQAVIQITDQGPGVPPDLLERIFEPFFRVGKARDRASGGHGIGLAITARVAALHGGSVRARNLPSGGLQVEITLPLQQSGTAAGSAAGTAALAGAALGSAARCRARTGCRGRAYRSSASPARPRGRPSGPRHPRFPTDSRHRLSLMPSAARAASGTLECVMVAGCSIRLSTPPSDSASANTWQRSRKARERSMPPSSSIEIMPPKASRPVRVAHLRTRQRVLRVATAAPGSAPAPQPDGARESAPAPAHCRSGAACAPPGS